MSWGAQNRSKDAKTPSVARALSDKPKPALCGIQPYLVTSNTALIPARDCLSMPLNMKLFPLLTPMWRLWKVPDL
jgi:hypothetical protein